MEYNVVITNNETLKDSTKEFLRQGILTVNPINLNSVLAREHIPSVIFLDEQILEERPDIIDEIEGAAKGRTKIIVDTEKRIFKQLISLSNADSSRIIPTELNNTVNTLLMGLRLFPTLKGYHYIKQALYIGLSDELAFTCIRKNIYMTIGEKFQSCEESVERDMAFAIRKAFKAKENTELRMLFPSNEIPTNGKFLCTLCQYINDKM